MSLELEHLALFELLKLPCSSLKEKKLLSMSKPLHYGGVFIDLWSLVESGNQKKLNFALNQTFQLKMMRKDSIQRQSWW